MDEVRIWAFGLSSAAIAGGLTELLLPKAGLKRVVQVVVSVFFLSCIFAPMQISAPTLGELFAGLPEELENLQSQTEQLQQSWSQTQYDYMEERIKSQAQAYLLEKGLAAEKIQLNYHDTEDGRISISECEIQMWVQPSTDTAALEKTLEQALGMPVGIKAATENPA